MPKKKTRTRPKPTMAELADPHRLYELAVQYPPAEIDFVDQTFKALTGRTARTLREDFCGTAQVCCEWATRRKTNQAIGVDIDAEVLDWGRRNNLNRLTAGQRGRISLLPKDVLETDLGPLDMILAMNFSYWLFKDRAHLKRYFAAARANLTDDGVLFLDAYGGFESFQEITEEQAIEDGAFTYIWEQASYDPISGHLVCHIHFVFPDQSRLDRAFSYDWRLWTLPEIRDLLQEVGFSQVTVYWQGYEDNGEPDGVFEPVEEGEADASWICYISALK